MNFTAKQLVGGAVGAAALIGIAVIVARSMYFSPRAELQRSLDDAQEYVDRFRVAIDQRPRINRDLEAIVDRTLGSDVETVDHRLRSRLNAIAEAVGLDGATVNASSPAARPSPIRRQFRDAELRNEPDFVELEGVVSAEGSLEQAIMLLDRIDAEQWIKRISQVRLDPRDNGRRVNVTVRVATLFIPGRAPADAPSPGYDPQRLARLAGLIEPNPFSVPPPAPAESAPAPRVTERPAPAFPYGQWIVTGVAEGRDGPEAWLRNRSSGETRRLAVGEMLEKARFVAANGDRALFEFDDEERFLVAVGSTLNDRSPLNE